jgi:lipopolysaccharide transport system permease protein
MSDAMVSGNSVGERASGAQREEWCSREAHGIAYQLREIWKFRELMWTLSLRSLKSRYRQTLLGASWAIIQPLTMTVVFTLVFGKFAKVDTGGAAYPVFAYAAMLPWQLFANIVNRGTGSVMENGAIIKKIYLPREICPLAAILVCLVDFGVAALALVIFMVYFHVAPTVLILFLPVLLLVEIVMALGIILFLSAVSVFYRDVGFGLPLVMQLGMFISPVAYSVATVAQARPQYLTWYMLNPMASIVDGFRRILVEQRMPQWDYVLYSAGVALLLVWLGYWYFKRAEGRFADVL